MISVVIINGVIGGAVVALGRPGLAVEQAAECIGPGLGGRRQLRRRVGVVLLALAQAQQGGQQGGGRGFRFMAAEVGEERAERKASLPRAAPGGKCIPGALVGTNRNIC